MKRVGLTAITIENFKSIGAPVTIPLRPITLLFGANSVGKSTVIQAMQYMHEVLAHRNPDPDYTMGTAVDLGGFRNLVHDHDLSRRIRLRFDLNVDDDGLPVYPRSEFGYAGVEYSGPLEELERTETEHHRARPATRWRPSNTTSAATSETQPIRKSFNGPARRRFPVSCPRASR